MHRSPLALRAAARIHRATGGVLIVALLLTAAATLGFTAWANLISQRRQNVEETVGSMTRRLAVENGRQLAIQLGYRELLTKNSGLALEGTQKANLQIMGGISTPPWAGFAMESVQPGKVNHFSPAGASFAYGPEFVHAAPYSVMDYYPTPSVRENKATNLTTAVRSRVPMLSGDLLNIYAPTLGYDDPLSNQTITGNLDVVGGRAVILTPAPLANFADLRASAVATPHYVPGAYPVNFKDPDTNAFALPSNFPSTLVTTGSLNAGHDLDIANHLNVVDAPNNPANSLRTKILNGLVYVTLDTTQDRPMSQGIGFASASGVLTLDLVDPSLWGVIVENNVAEIVITGQPSSSDDQASVRILYVESADLTSRSLQKITFSGATNLRPMVIGIKKIPAAATSQIPGSPVNLAYADSNIAPLWKTMLVVENTPLVFEAAGGPGVITMQGGIMTDGAISSTTGAGNVVRLVPETDHTHLIQLVPRRAWMETYLNYTDGSL